MRKKEKRKKVCASVLALLLSVAMILGMIPGEIGQVYAAEQKTKGEPVLASAFDAETKADPSTLQTWKSLVSNTTENIGRIWTDKTVSTEDMAFDGTTEKAEIGDSQFLVALSALSSTSNTVAMSEKPLDIVLVLDVSGSMGNRLGTIYIYEEVYDINTGWWGPSYYAINDNGDYVEIDKIPYFGFSFDHWELEGKEVEPKTSASDNTEGHIQFYTRKEENITKMEALKSAVNSFAEAAAKRNDDIQDVTKQHALSVVKFADDSTSDVYGDDKNGGYNYTQRLNPLTKYTSTTISTLTDSVNKLDEAGSTAADFGLSMARKELTQNGRKDAQKVVIFFTDGEPNHQNGFDSSVANDAIANAAKLKSEDQALVYSIGVFENADPTNTSTADSNRFNAYMHGVSSNYPNASSWKQLGTREADSDYYKAATNADELTQIFTDIFEDVSIGSGFPTNVTQGYEPNKGGYVTFYDQLGSYMQVDEFKTILFADKKFNLNRDTGIKTEGNVTTYTFEGEGGNALYPQGNLHDILITVTKSDDLKTGDIVEVKVPASMVPLRHFKVDTDINGQATMNVDEAWPIHIMYGASIKPKVIETLRDGLDDSADDAALEAYLEENKTTTGGNTAALFYSNAYTGTSWPGHPNKTLGDTVASFEPAKGNTFYYFTKDTPIYTDENFEHPVTDKPVSGDTYYYAKTYWALENGQAVEKTKAFPFASDNFEQASANWEVNDKNEVYIKAGSARLTRVDALTLSKENNATSTATEVINPLWDNVNNPQTLHVYLGNNGLIAVEVPGALEITKDATVATDKNLNEEEVVKDKEFAFKINIPDMKNKTVKAEKRNLQNELLGEVFDLTFDSKGDIVQSVKLKNNERLYIQGLDAGASYTVTEDGTSMPKGFSLTSVVTDGKEEKTEKAEGTIEAGISKRHTFVNTYDVKSVDAKAFAPFKKTFERWDLASEFDMMLVADSASYPMPEGSKNGQKIVKATEENSNGNFGTITFSAPGTYGYTVLEKIENEDRVSGVNYSKALYDVTVTVSDNGDGTLSVDSIVMKKTNGDDGLQIPEGQQQETSIAEFVNTFDADSASLSARVRKEYTDTTGGSISNGQFRFKMTPRTDLDEGDTEQENRPQLPAGTQFEDDGKSIIVSNIGNNVHFGEATYNADCIGNTYAYELTEVVPDEVTAESPKLDGMQYDLNRYLVKMAVTKGEDAEGKAKVVVNASYYRIETDQSGKEIYTFLKDENDKPVIPVFTNVYDPEDLILPGDGQNAVCGSKTLEGRDSLPGETFTFTLSAANEATATGLANDWIVFENDPSKTEMQANVTELINKQEKPFDFGEVRFTRPGIYQFNVVENAPENGKGMVYDRHTALVTVTVNDRNGTLEGNVTYNNGQGTSEDKAAFVNVYKAGTVYGNGMDLNLSKTLNGRAQTLGEFKFKIAGQTEEADLKLNNADREFTTIAPADDGVASKIFNKLSGVQFDETDAGKTFSYTVQEVLPEDDDAEVAGVQNSGVTYTQMQYQVDIQVKDNGDGTMSTLTTVSRTYDDAGNRLDTPEVLETYNSADGKDVCNVISFINTYAAKSVTVDTDTDENVMLTKQLKGRSWKETDRFQFTLKANNPADAPLPVKNGQQTTTAEVSQPAGTEDSTVVDFGFGSITFDKPGDYYYQVTEAHAGETIDGISYDSEAASIWIQVKDSGNGQLTAEVNTTDSDFVNTYGAVLNHNAAGGIVTAKTLNGHDMADRQFTFQVEALDGTGTTAEENAKRIGVKDGTTELYRNDRSAKAGETLTMKTEDKNAIEFTADDVGKTMVYRFSEKGADGNFGTGGTKDGYIYDGAVYTVELGVTDDGDGTLTLHTTVKDKEGKVLIDNQTSNENDPKETVVSFVNNYTPDEISVEPGTFAGKVTKVLKGNRGTDLKNGEFTFRMKITAADGSSMDNVVLSEGAVDSAVTSANKADGSVNFGNISFKAAGTYHVEISEVIPIEDADPNMTYDGHTFSYDIVVTYDAAKGELSAAAAEESKSGSATFTNVYEKGEPKDVFTGTGDAKTSVNGKMVGVGDELTYTIDWVNNASDEKGQPTEAEVTVTDIVPTGTDFVIARQDGTYDNTTNTITWSLGKQKPGASGTVSFVVKVTDEAAKGGTVENTASITIGKNDPKTTNTTVTHIPGKTVANNDVEASSIKVGDTVTYTIKYHNTESESAEVIIRDRIPDGTDYVDGSAGDDAVYDKESRTLTWTLQDVKPNTSGEVTFKAVVNESALKESVKNKATVQIGENGPQVKTNTETFEVKVGDVTLSKEVQVTEGQGTNINKKQVFTFIVKLTDCSGKELSGTYKYEIAGASEEKDLKNGSRIELTHNQTAKIKGLPEGAVCTVTEEPVTGYTSKDGAEKSAEVIAEQTQAIRFVNVYNAAAGELTEGSLNVEKALSGREWKETDRFIIQLEAKGGRNAAGDELEASEVPMPVGASENKITLDLTKEKQNASFGTISYSKVGTYNYIVTELQPAEGAIEGITYSKASYDVKVNVTDKGDGTLNVAFSLGQTADDQGEEIFKDVDKAVFTNTYTALMLEEDKAATNAVFTKVVNGRQWIQSDSFTFRLAAVTNGAPLPKDAEGNDVTEKTVTAADVLDGKADFSFGVIEYSLDMVKEEENRTKEFVYEVTEVEPGEGEAKIAGMTYDTHKAIMKITVSDDGEGYLQAVTTIENNTFTNVYQSKMDYNSIGGLQISKTLNGRDLQKDQFTFTVTPKETVGSTTAEEAAQKLGLRTDGENAFTNGAAQSGEAAITDVLAGKNVVFTQADAGKTYTYEVSEKAGENAAYTYDTETAIVTITAEDHNDATLTVTTVVTKGGKEVDRQVVATGAAEASAATVPFVNEYNDQPGYLGGRGSVKLEAEKTLTNRPLSDGEFTFNVLDQNNNIVTSGVNDAAGKITFGEVEYTTDQLNQDAASGIAVKKYDAQTDQYTYSYAYKVVEDLTDAGEGITGITTEFAVTVTVSDNGDGTLAVKVTYPEGSNSLVFENAYGTGAEAELSVNGQKVLNVESGNNAPDITGKYTFTLEGSEGAPMPENMTAVNDAAGNVIFGKIVYTMENVFGDTGVQDLQKEKDDEKMPEIESRTKTFTYTVKESGSAAGVRNDTEKVFHVTVTDNGDGTISVDKDYENFAFVFTNTYSVTETEYSISTDISVTKMLEGRDLRNGEFTFELISDKDKSIREAVNDENGKVAFDSITYTTPGEYSYTIRERNTGLKGITYDAREYKVVVKVTDNGDGTMSASAESSVRSQEIVFENSYKASPTSVVLGTSKILKNKDLKAGQFTFLLKEDGTVIDEATNDQDGQVMFKSIGFESAGTYKYVIAEKNDKQKNIIYDTTEYGVTIEVTDDGEGSLNAVVHYDQGVPPTFMNKYVKPAEPKPEEPKQETPKPSEPEQINTVQTGDKTPLTGTAVILAAALAAMIGAAGFAGKKRRK